MQVKRGLFSAFATGLLFGLGLCISQMIDPAKVINFLDLAGNWDPSLALVMGAALGLNFFATKVILKRPAPLFSDVFRLPTKQEIDRKLIAGSALFGIGWGLAGYCPGPALTSLSFVNFDILLLVGAYVLGTGLGVLINKSWKDQKADKAEAVF